MADKLRDLKERPFAFTDLETSGDIFSVHEILEIGLVVVDQRNLEILDTLNIKVKPEHIKEAIPVALEKNGYNEKDWSDAVSLEIAIKEYAQKTTSAIFCAYNATFDWGFINDAFRKTGIEDRMDYHRLDILSIAWDRGLKEKESWSLKTASKIFGVPPEPEPHSALNGAMAVYQLFKKLNS